MKALVSKSTTVRGGKKPVNVHSGIVGIVTRCFYAAEISGEVIHPVKLYLAWLWYKQNIGDSFMLLYSVTFGVEKWDRESILSPPTVKQRFWFWQDLRWMLLLWRFVQRLKSDVFLIFCWLLLFLYYEHLLREPDVWNVFHPRKISHILRTRFGTCWLTWRLMRIERRIKLACESQRQPLITQ